MDNEVSRNLQRFKEQQFKQGLAQGLELLCEQISADAAKNVASKTRGYGDGTLAASITYEVDKDKLEGTVGTNVEYAPYVHNGTGLYAVNGNGRKDVPWVYRTKDGKFFRTEGIKPNPFLKDALEEDVPKYSSKAFAEGVDAVWKM